MGPPRFRCATPNATDQVAPGRNLRHIPASQDTDNPLLSLKADVRGTLTSQQCLTSYSRDISAVLTYTLWLRDWSPCVNSGGSVKHHRQIYSPSAQQQLSTNRIAVAVKQRWLEDQAITSNSSWVKVSCSAAINAASMAAKDAAKDAAINAANSAASAAADSTRPWAKLMQLLDNSRCSNQRC